MRELWFTPDIMWNVIDFIPISFMIRVIRVSDKSSYQFVMSLVTSRTYVRDKLLPEFDKYGMKRWKAFTPFATIYRWYRVKLTCKSRGLSYTKQHRIYRIQGFVAHVILKTVLTQLMLPKKSDQSKEFKSIMKDALVDIPLCTTAEIIKSGKWVYGPHVCSHRDIFCPRIRSLNHPVGVISLEEKRILPKTNCAVCSDEAETNIRIDLYSAKHAYGVTTFEMRPYMSMPLCKGCNRVKLWTPVIDGVWRILILGYKA